VLARGALVVLVVFIAGILPATAGADHDGAAPPINDAGDQAFGVALNSTVENHENNGATTQIGERTDCNGNIYGHTVWYWFETSARGQVVVTVRGTSTLDFAPLDTVISLQGEGSIGQAPIACDDDGAGQVGGGSRIDVTLNPGSYYVQIGTFDYPPGFRPGVIGPDLGRFSIDVRFAQDLDLDDDGYAVGQDCNDGNPAVHPNTVDVEFNGIDEDCVGGDDRDRDNDGFPQGADCNDRKRSVNPGVREVPGDFEDENCDGKKRAALLSPFPTVVFPNLGYSDRTVVSKLEVKDVARGYRVRVLCKGGGCPGKALKRRLRSRKSTRIGAFTGQVLRPGAIVEVYVTKPGTNTVGKYVRFEVRSGKSAKRVDCRVSARTGGPVACKGP
jgi:Putative metal-binding motif